MPKKLSEDDLTFFAFSHAERDVETFLRGREHWQECEWLISLGKQFKAYRKKRWPHRATLDDGPGACS